MRAEMIGGSRSGTARMPGGGGLAALVAILLTSSAPLAAQSPATSPQVDQVTISGSLRTRIESWDWFGDDPNGEYTYPGSIVRLSLGQSKRGADWRLEFAIPFLVGLPDRAIAPAPQGALGLGANYFSANQERTNAAAFFVKQAFVRLKRLGGVEGQSLKIGRLEFIDGTEVIPRNPTLAALKRDRIAHRLVGNFGFSHVGRSLDGVQYGFERPTFNVTVVGARPTRGVFQVDGWGELNVNVFYAAVTRPIGETATGEWRLFGLGYRDGRDTVLKTDNRPLDLRRADRRSITIGTFGGHYLGAVDTTSGTLDLLLWGAAQVGSWGELDHRAGAIGTEAGWQPRIFRRVAPWIRGGLLHGSGDGDPADATHATFFQALPTPRVYARFPFFNMMNTDDAFVELILRPSRSVTVRADVHSLRLADATDLWYQGGGAFQTSTFGYAGRPSNGHSDFGTLYDLSGDLALTRHLAVSAYYSYVAGKRVTRSVHPGGRGARFGYLEISVQF